MNNACEDCRAVGLPVFPLRYAVAPKDLLPSGLTGFSGERVVDVELGEGETYVARLLRRGFVYVFHEKGAHGTNYWDAYAVADDGTLWKQPAALEAKPVARPTCSRSGHSAVRMQFFVIEKPEQSGPVWLAFSEHAWSRKTLTMYRKDAGKRARRMQKIEPAQWMAEQSAAEHRAILASGADFQTIVEYCDAVQRGRGGEPLMLPHAEVAPAVAASAVGAFSDDALRQRSSLYPPAMRVPPTDEEAEALLDAMGKVLDAHTGKQAAVQPMAVALWDAIGIVHELNGYRNDVLGWYGRYAEAHERHIHAMQAIEAARTAVEQGAQNRMQSGIRNLFGDDQPDPQPHARGDREVEPTLRRAGMRQSRAFMRDYHRARVDYRNHRIDLPAFRQRRAALLEQHAVEDAQHPGVQAELARDEQALGQFRQNVSQFTQAAGDRAWPRYEPRLNRSALTAFETNFRRANTLREQVMAERLVSLKAWLESELLLDTLEDFHEDDLDDGAKYSEVVATGIDSLAGDAAGQAYLKELVGRTEVSGRQALVWRAVALNQKDTRPALQQFLAVVESNRRTPMQAGAAVFLQGLALLKPVADAYDDVKQRRLPRTPSATHHLRLSGLDRLAQAIGGTVFERWRVAALGEFVGENLIKGLFLRRVGVNARELADLIQTEAQHQPALRAAFFAQVRAFKAQGSRTPMAQSWEWLGQHRSGQIMRDKWNRLTTSNLNSAHLAAIVALCEAGNFIKLLSQADKSGSDYAMLVAAGLSTSGALAMVALEPSRRLFGEASRSFQRWQMLGGALAGGATLIGAVVDFAEGGRHLTHGYRLVGGLLIIKGAASSLVGGAFVLTALTASAPLIQRLAGRTATVVLLERMGTGLATAAAIRSGQAAAQRSAMVLVGRGVLMLTGWKVTVAVMAVQGVIWIFTPDKLEQWIDGTPFGSKRPHPSLQQQDKLFGQALAEVGA